jgi:hypothetical protein
MRHTRSGDATSNDDNIEHRIDEPSWLPDHRSSRESHALIVVCFRRKRLEQAWAPLAYFIQPICLVKSWPKFF